ncbi:PQQ-binding-like beta-propeller repeat protein [Ramlibacter monticola]|uniref:PQQ-binding-like beta-propeller repeat protein n=2 Tax=Ramlibacter monticola TaxID=1926872 RepID=A0A936Z4I6_9BURK|nr:PQQ-binding-like beta-propeller repeat protein [Ramlibacter monticola]
MLRSNPAAKRPARRSPFRRALGTAMALGVAAVPLGLLAATDLSTVPLPTFAVGSAVDIKPNILMVLDDSGSMDWNYLPDWANDRPSNYSSLPAYLFRNASFNGVSYNPAVRYLPPVTFNSSGTKETYASMNGTSAATGADMTQTRPNWRAVMFDGYNVQKDSSGNRPLTNLETDAYFYTIQPGEYCDSPALTNCTTSAVPTGNFQYAAPLRWCNSNALTSCRGLWAGSSYDRPRMAAPRMATIAFSNPNNAAITSIKVDGKEILSASTASTSTNTTVAQRVAAAINACQLVQTGNCTTVGYFAFDNGAGTVRIYAPGATPSSPVVTNSGTVTSTTAAFARQSIPLVDWNASSTTRSTNPVPGENLLTVITRSVTSYPFPGATNKAAARTDCAGTTCTYEEEMTNYANWWAYYRTRMQMMKTATSRAFASLDTEADIAANRTRYRIGYLSINNNTTSDFVNITDFNSSQKFTWYSKLFAAKPANSTPLRTALSTAGRLYGGVLNGSTLNGTRVTDPMQFSCQRNYTILSTDGFWNGGGGVKLDGTTAMDNQDGPLPRPYNDGATSQNQARTSKLQRRINTQVGERGTLQRQVSQLQTRTAQLQKRTNNGSWSNATSCDPDKNTDCRYVDGAWANAASCTKVDRSSGNGNWTVAIARDCQTVVTSAFINVPSCTPTTTPDASGQTIQCQYAFAAAAAVQNCSPLLVANDFSNAAVYRNCTTQQGTLTDVASCTPSSTPNAAGETVTCGYSAWGTWSNVTSCTAVAQSPGPTYTVGTARECQLTASGGTTNTLADIAAYYYNHDLRDPDATGADATGTCTGPIVAPATTASDLCANNVKPYGKDVGTKQHMTTHTLGLGAQGQMVYSNFQNDLSGQRVYQPDYWLQQTGDFFTVANGSTASPTTGICPWLSAGSTCSWPTPAADSTANIDDLWHAAVNGHGTYFSAADPVSLADALSGMLAQINNPPRPGTAAAAASSNPNITSSDNFVFSSSYKSVEWFGELIMQKIVAGQLTRQEWSAMQLLDCATSPWQANRQYKRNDAFQRDGLCYAVVADYTSSDAFDVSDTGNDGQNVVRLNGTPVTRNIYTVGEVSGTSQLIPFTWASLNSNQRDFFSRSAISFVSASRGLTQFCTSGATCMTDTAQDSAAGSALVSYLRGDRTNEGNWYRTRSHVLGDIVNAEARYVKQPLTEYLDPGFSDYKASMASRQPTVYVAANDGMLHAFDALTGQERWAFVPSAVLPEMYRLADVDYATKRRYFVDGTPEIGDICPKAPAATCSGSEWRTIIVGGLNQGGKSYYALDITNPTSPTLLWEFTNSNLGFSYGNPRITKLSNGTWVVIVASGYNNADGVGRVFVINAKTGALINTISTGVGTAAEPSGLAKLQARAPNAASNNTVEEVYGGDLLGNLWRFDVNNTVGAPGTDAQLLVQLRDAAGNPQPITSKPVVAAVASNPMVIVGTGRYLGQTDLTDTRQQTMYAVKDKLDSTTLATPRQSGSNFVQQTLVEQECPQGSPLTVCTPGQQVRTVTASPVDWGVKNGWFVDLALQGERSVTDATLAVGTLVFTTIKPQPPSTALIVGCSGESSLVDAKSFLYFLDYLTGGPVQGTRNVAGSELCTCVATRPSVVRTEQGQMRGIIRVSGGGSTGSDAGGGTPSDGTGDGSGNGGPQQPITDLVEALLKNIPFAPNTGPARRISWRELNGD